MSRRSTPSCTLHRPSGQARVRIDGRDHYLGKFGSPEAERKYRRLIGRWLESHGLPEHERQTLSVAKLAAGYLAHCEAYCKKTGRPTSQIAIVRNALKRLVKANRHMPTVELGPKRIKALRRRMIDEGRKRPA